MEDSSLVQTEVEVDHYEEIVDDLNYSAPVTSRPASPCYWEDRLTAATFQGPITHTSESTVTSASATIVDSVTWPDLRSPCSLAGKYQEPRPLAQRSDGRSLLRHLLRFKRRWLHMRLWSKIEAKFHTFWPPVKIREVVSETSELIISATPRTNPTIDTFDEDAGAPYARYKSSGQKRKRKQDCFLI